MDRQDLMYAYSELNIEQRRALSKIMNCTMASLYRYCMKPYSDHIGKERYEKLLEFMDLKSWMNLARQGRINNINNKKPTVMTINFAGMITPDVVMIGKQKYIKA